MVAGAGAGMRVPAGFMRRASLSVGPLLLALLLVDGFGLARGDQAAQVQASASLRLSLLQDYAKTLPPDEGVQVQVQFALYKIVEVSTPLQIIRFSGWWRHYWSDLRLQWNATAWGIDSIVFSFSEVWTPDDTIYDVISDVLAGQVVVTAYPDGSLFYSVPKVSTVGCNMELKSFPFDTQKCGFTVGSLAYDASFVDVIPRTVDAGVWKEEDGVRQQTKTSIDLGSYTPNPEYSLVSLKIVSRNNFYSCCVYPFPVIIFDLEIKRQTLTYVSGIILPLICVTLVGFFALLMPAPMSGSRPTLSVSIAFTTSSIYLVASQKLPEVGTWTLIGRLYLASMGASLFMTFLSILSTGVNLVTQQEKQHRMDLLKAFETADSDKSGTLNEKEVLQALRILGLSPEERDHWFEGFNLQTRPRISQDEWMDMAQLHKNYTPLTQYNFPIASLLHYMQSSPVQTPNTSVASLASRKKDADLRAVSMTQVNAGNFGFQDDLQRPPPRVTSASTATVPSLLADVGFQRDLVNVPGGRLRTVQSPGQAIMEEQATPTNKTDQPSNEGRHQLQGLAEADAHLVTEWLSLLGLPNITFLRFKEQEIDVEALSQLLPIQLAGLGVEKLGHQTKLVSWAKTKMEQGKAGKDLPTAGSNGPARSDTPGSSSQGQSGGEVTDVEKALTIEELESLDRAPEFVRTDSYLKQKKMLETAAKKGLKGNWMNESSKHFGATIDFWNLLICPTLFMLYLCLEFGGVFTGERVEWFTTPSEDVETLVYLVDERAETWGNSCFGNYQLLAPPAPDRCQNFSRH